jgi:hypothetical protein
MMPPAADSLLLRLFDIAFQTRCILPLIISAGFMVKQNKKKPFFF